jgi:hypothetical protein
MKALATLGTLVAVIPPSKFKNIGSSLADLTSRTILQINGSFYNLNTIAVLRPDEIIVVCGASSEFVFAGISGIKTGNTFVFFELNTASPAVGPLPSRPDQGLTFQRKPDGTFAYALRTLGQKNAFPAIPAVAAEEAIVNKNFVDNEKAGALTGGVLQALSNINA